MDQTSVLLQQYQNVLSLYKYTNEIRQSRIGWGLGLETALVAAVAAFGEHLAVAVAVSALGAALALTLFLIARRHSKHAHLWSAEGREIEARLEDLSGGQLVLTAFRNEKRLFEPKSMATWVKSIFGHPVGSITFPHTDETVKVGLPAVSANFAEEALMVFLFLGWLAVLILFRGEWLEIRR
jgi:hypothetical protein